MTADTQRESRERSPALLARRRRPSPRRRSARTRTPQTDRTVTVAKGTRLNVSNDAGEVVLRTWDRDSLRVQASHTARVTDRHPDDRQHRDRAVARVGRPAGGVDYEITAPAWLPVKVSGQFIYIGIEGAQNEVSAETVRGDIVVKGGSGFVTAKSIQGEVIVEDAKGRINASSVNEGIRITGAIGDITAETTNGDIIADQGRSQEPRSDHRQRRHPLRRLDRRRRPYRFSTHNGDITMILPENTNATFTVRTYNGDFSSNLPTKAVGEVPARTARDLHARHRRRRSRARELRRHDPAAPAGHGPGRRVGGTRTKDEHRSRTQRVVSPRAARPSGPPAPRAAAGVAAAATAVSVSKHGNRREGPRIVRAGPETASRRTRSARSRATPRRRWRRPCAASASARPTTIPTTSLRLRAERHANANLPRALTDQVRQHAVDPDRGEQQRQHRETADQPNREPARRRAGGLHVRSSAARRTSADRDRRRARRGRAAPPSACGSPPARIDEPHRQARGLRQRPIDHRAWADLEVLAEHVADDADDRHPRRLAARRTEMHAAAQSGSCPGKYRRAASSLMTATSAGGVRRSRIRGRAAPEFASAKSSPIETMLPWTVGISADWSCRAPSMVIVAKLR